MQFLKTQVWQSADSIDLIIEACGGKEIARYGSHFAFLVKVGLNQNKLIYASKTSFHLGELRHYSHGYYHARILKSFQTPGSIVAVC